MQAKRYSSPFRSSATAFVKGRRTVDHRAQRGGAQQVADGSDVKGSGLSQKKDSHRDEVGCRARRVRNLTRAAGHRGPANIHVGPVDVSCGAILSAAPAPSSFLPCAWLRILPSIRQSVGWHGESKVGQVYCQASARDLPDISPAETCKRRMAAFAAESNSRDTQRWWSPIPCGDAGWLSAGSQRT